MVAGRSIPQGRPLLGPRGRGMLGASLRYFGLAVAALVIIFPVYLALITSILPDNEAATVPPHLLTLHPTFDNFRRVVDIQPMWRFLWNSLVAAGCITLAQMATAALAAYAFVFLRFPFRNLLFFIFLSTLMVPAEATIVPNFQTMLHLHWINTYQALVVPFAATAFGTFLLRQFFLSLPSEIMDAARVDGCGHMRTLWSVVLPLSRPAFATLGAYAFLAAWNQYLWPLIATNKPSMQTVQIGLRALQGNESSDPGLTMAGTVLAVVPPLILLVLAQRHIVRGLTSGAVKG
ncbi:MAG: carbohydrate ABC transporter permease [Dehalococcoidia bacterium]